MSVIVFVLVFVFYSWSQPGKSDRELKKMYGNATLLLEFGQ